MTRAHLFSKKYKSKPHSPGKKETANSQTDEVREESSDLIHLQDQIGNQAVQQVLARRNVPETLRLDPETAARFQPGGAHLVQVLAKLPEGASPQVQRQIVEEAIQRQEEAGTGPQAQPANGAVTIDPVTYEYYDVNGSTLAEVGGQLDPEEWGRCTYQVDYSYETTNGRTSKVDITLRLTIRLPRWQGKGWDKASPAAKREWQRMVRALEGHEEEHAAMARQWAPTSKERLLNQREARVQQRYEQTLQQLNRETEAFDKRTKHGQAQGVSLDITIQ